MFSESISQASSCLSDINLVEGATFDKVYHVVACTGVLGIDGDMSPRNVDRRCSTMIGVGACTAPGPTVWKRTSERKNEYQLSLVTPLFQSVQM